MPYGNIAAGLEVRRAQSFLFDALYDFANSRRGT